MNSPDSDILTLRALRKERMKDMKKLPVRILTLCLLLSLLVVPVLAAQTLVPVGCAVGLELDADGLTVAGFDETLGAAARAAGLEEGDLIVKADGLPLTSVDDLRSAVDKSRDKLVLTVHREGREVNLTAMPQSAGAGKCLGIFVKEGVTGVGTVTYFDPATGEFGALGHGVSDSRGELLPLRAGRVMKAQVASVKKGRVGTPGQLVGAFREEECLGELEKNTKCGIFGTSAAGWSGTPLPVVASSEIHTGEAVIRANISGETVQEYSVEILKVYPGESTRNLLVHVTDPALLDATGGIVQGMSGSPIIQDGKLIGAVTHVLVNDPTTGYGIFIENMLNAAA